MTTPDQRAPAGRVVCACVTPGVTLGVTWHRRPIPLLQTHSYYRDGWGGVGGVEWQAARNARSVPQRSLLTGTGCVWTGGKRSDFSL